MKRWQAQAEVSFLFRVADNFYIGPMASYDYVIGKHIERPELLQGMDQHTWNVGAGVSLVYDNRDNLTNPHRGIFLNINQMFRPGFMGNDYAFSTTAFRFDAYQRLGKGTVLAEDIGANLNFGNPSWGMMAELGVLIPCVAIMKAVIAINILWKLRLSCANMYGSVMAS